MATITEREIELNRRQAELAHAYEEWTAAVQDHAIWAEATAAANRRWLVLIDHQLQRWSRNGNVHQVLLALRNAGVGRDSAQVEG